MANLAYEDVIIGRFNSQMCLDRYPLPSSFGDIDDNDEPPQIPLPAWWRLNVVAASQKHNLFFVAFKDKLHVTVPRGNKQEIPSVPDAILSPPVSEDATRGLIDPGHPHAMNSMKIGMLGDLEILLLACDDGDIIAYYTHVLAHYIVPKSSNSTLEPGMPAFEVKPFFLENVGASAWGLAIHAESRLLAVGSNYKEVTVFSFAPSPFGPQGYFSDDMNSKSYKKGLAEVERIALRSTVLFRKLYIPEQRPRLTQEFANIAMTLELGPGGDNLPSVDFVSDTLGRATHVIAADIKGKLWYLDLNCKEKRYEDRPGHERQTRYINRGWGVINIPLSCFMKVTTIADALGPSAEGDQKYILNAADAEIEKRKHMNKISPPSFNTPENSAILRLFTKDIQLLPPTYDAIDLHNPLRPPPIRIRDVVTETVVSQQLQQIQDIDRLNMFALIPELHVVIVGSQIGRVAVMTLTRLRNTAVNEPVTAIRCDALLPFEEHLLEYRPPVPLLGCCSCTSSKKQRGSRTVGIRSGRLFGYGFITWTILFSAMRFLGETIIPWGFSRDIQVVQSILEVFPGGRYVVGFVEVVS